MNARAALWLAVVLAEVAALVMAVRLDQGISDHLRKLVGVLRKAAQQIASGVDVAVFQRAADVKGDGLKVGDHAGSIAVDAESRKHIRPVVALLAAAVVIDLLVAGGQCVALEGPRAVVPFAVRVCAASPAPRPFVGLARAWYHVETALVMGWPGALAWASWRVFGGVQKANAPDCSRAFPVGGVPSPPSPRAKGVGFSHDRGFSGRCAGLLLRLAGPRSLFSHDAHEGRVVNGSRRTHPLDYLAGIYVGAVIGLAGLHPLAGGRVAGVLMAWELVALGFAVAAVALGWRRAVRGETRWTVAHGVLLVLVPVELAVVVIGPFARPDLFSAWAVARWQYLAAFGIVAGMLGISSRVPGERAPPRARSTRDR